MRFSLGPAAIVPRWAEAPALWTMGGVVAAGKCEGCAPPAKYDEELTSGTGSFMDGAQLKQRTVFVDASHSARSPAARSTWHETQLPACGARAPS